MELVLEQLIPYPLKERKSIAGSDIWSKEVRFTQPEYISVRAPSGTGKTTLIHTLYGIRTDYEGTVRWDGKALNTMDSEALSNLRSGQAAIIFQDLRLFPELSAWENLDVKRNLTGTISAAEAESWMQRLDIGDKKNALTATLSYGEQQRLAIIRSLMQPFSFLLMDEPFSHLDQGNIALAAGLILEVVQRNNAGLMLADLDENTYFPYHKTYLL